VLSGDIVQTAGSRLKIIEFKLKKIKETIAILKEEYHLE